MSVFADRQTIKPSNLSLKIIVSFLLFSIFVFLPTYFVPFFHVDEGFWATVSKYLFSGEFYDRFTDHKPPFLFELFWLFSFGSRSMAALHIMQALWVGVGAIACWRILLRYVDDKTAVYASIIFLCFMGIVNYGAFSAERAYVPLILFSILFALKSLESSPMIWVLISGAMAGFAASIKQPAGLLCLVALSYFPRSRLFVSYSLLWVIALLATGLFTWIPLQVPFERIWSEAYAANFKYMKFNSFHAWESSKDVLQNIILIVFFSFLPLTLSFIGALRRLLKDRLAIRSALFIQLSFFFVCSLVVVSLGQRFLQQYFSALVPALVFIAVYFISQKNVYRKGLLMASIFWIVMWHGIGLYKQVNNKNQNWDAFIVRLVDEIKEDTSPEDLIWISNALHGVYYASDRKPAVTHLFFQTMLGYTDPCRASDDGLKEILDDPRYQKSLRQLRSGMPKVIFWNQRPANSCAHRLKIENFPEIKKILDENYSLKWEGPEGFYFLRKNFDF